MTTPAYLWADGKYRDELPPSAEPMPLPGASTLPEEKIAVADPSVAILPPALPEDWMPTTRYQLRYAALQAAIAAAGVAGKTETITRADIKRDAEAIEQWLGESGTTFRAWQEAQDRWAIHQRQQAAMAERASGAGGNA